jgi:cell division protein ZapA
MSAAKPAAAADATVTLDVSLLGREFKVSCRESERAQLMEAVAFLDRRMRDIRDTTKVVGSERIAVMAALNIAHDLLRARSEAAAPKPERPAPAIDDASARRRILVMRSAIDQALAEPAQHVPDVS